MKTSSAIVIAALLTASTVDATPLDALGVELHGFLDARAGGRTRNDPTQHDDTLGEGRLQLDLQRHFDAAALQLRSDFLHDWVRDDPDIDLETGRGWIDLREANVLFYPAGMADVKIGRQILTWGTGDLIFINDLFPKDWQSFLSGRDEEYLKAPSDAVFVSLFPAWLNIDVAYTPRFDADRFVSGERLSFYNRTAGALTGADMPVAANQPDDAFTDDEIAVRLSRNVAGYELAAYGYYGLWKSPGGVDPDSGRATFPRLGTIGASARGQIAGGIGAAEFGIYDSRDDRRGDNPFVRNGELRFLTGYQRELARDFSVGLQYYLEFMLDHAAYQRTLPPGQPVTDEDRHLLTLRLTRQLMNQNLTLSLFSFYSPSDHDAYMRPVVAYKATDNWLVVAGGNLFQGEQPHTFFGQFENNSNLYAGVRYSF